jgi:lysylphosphatidylglycerol synthetase-like protein (DUF2156 family)
LNNGVPLDLRAALLRQHGCCSSAYSATHQPGLDHFGDERGFIAFDQVGRTAFVLADPIAPPGYWPELVQAFVAAHRDVCFVQGSRPLATVLASMGFWINEFGVESRLDLSTYDLSGRKKRTLRRAANRADEQGVVIRECSIRELGADIVAEVSRDWLRSRPMKHSSVRFLTRPIVLDDEPDVRKFFAFDAAGRLLAFNFFDPYYDDGQVVAYVDAFRRRVRDGDPLLNYAILCRAIQTFQGEGKRWLSLGLSPIAQIEDKDFRKNWLVRRTFRFIYTNTLFNRFIYSFQGLELNKREFDGIAEQTYFAFNTLPALPRLIKLLRACGVLGLSFRARSQT